MIKGSKVLPALGLETAPTSCIGLMEVMMMIAIVRVVVTSYAILAFALVQLNADTPLERTFRSQAPKGWKRLASYVSQIEGTGTDVQNLSAQKGHVLTVNWDFKVNGDRVVYEDRRRTQGPGPRQRHMAQAVNGDYAFRLLRDPDAGTWEIDSINETDKGMDLIALIPKTMGFQRFLHCAWKLEGVEFSEVMGHPSFRLQSISKADSGLIRVEFEYDAGNTGPGATGGNIGPGSVEFDPEMDWAIQRYDVKPHFGRIAVELVYSGDSKAEPYVSEALVIYSSPKGTREWKWTTTSLARVDVPDDAFRLTAYGFPEPAQPPKKNRTTGLIIAGVAFALLIAAIVFYRRA